MGQPAWYVEGTSAAVIADTVPTKAGGEVEVVVDGMLEVGGAVLVDVVRRPASVLGSDLVRELEHDASIVHDVRTTRPSIQAARPELNMFHEDSSTGCLVCGLGPL